MAVRTVYDDGALRVLGGLSAPEVGAGRAFGAGVQQRQEQRKGELGMDATRLNMEQTRQTMRLREEAAKRAAAANARAQSQRAAMIAATQKARTAAGGFASSRLPGQFQTPTAGGVRTPTENFRDFGGGSQVPLSFGSAGAPSTGGAGGGANTQVGLQYPATPAGGPQLATAGLSTQSPVPATPMGGPQLAMPVAAPAGVQVAGLSGPEAFRLAMQSRPEMFGVQTADASGAAPVGVEPVLTYPDGRTIPVSNASPEARPLLEQGLAAGPDPVYVSGRDYAYFVYSDGRVFDTVAARYGRDPFDVPTNVQADIRAQAGVTATPEAAPEAAPAAPAAPEAAPEDEQPLFPQAPDEFALTQLDMANFVPGLGLVNYVQYNPATGEVRGPNGETIDPIIQEQMRESASFGYASSIENTASVAQNRLDQARAAIDQAAATGDQDTYARALDEFRAAEADVRAAQATLPDATAALRTTQPITSRSIFSEEGPGVEGAPRPPAQTAGVQTPGTGAAPEQAAKQAASFTLEDQLKLSERLTGKQRLTLLSEPRALNPEIQRLVPKLDGLNEAVDILLGAGLYTQAAEYEKQAMELFNNISLMIANQAVNEAVYYNAPARLEAVLSGTSLGPVRVRAYRKGNEAVFSVETPGGQPLSQQLTEMTKAELSSVVRPFFDKEYAAAQAKAAAESQAAFDKAYATKRGEVIGEAEGEVAVRAALGLPANQTLEYVTSTTVIDSENNAADALVFKTEDGKTFSVHEEIGPSGTRERVTREYYAPPVIGQ